MSNEKRDPLIDSVARELRQPVRVDPAFDARVAAAIQASRTHRGRVARFARWLLEPRTVTLSPLAGLAAAAALVAIAALGARMIPPSAGGAGGEVRAEAHAVRFVFIAPAADSVALVGDFNNWSITATPMRRVVEHGAWSVAVPLRPGRYTYSFVVNGTTWVADPLAPPAPQDDDFGKPNSVVLVRSPST